MEGLKQSDYAQLIITEAIARNEIPRKYHNPTLDVYRSRGLIIDHRSKRSF
jgi:hypothetical protein